MTLKEKVHRLVDDLPSKELSAAARFLGYLRDMGGDPLLAALAQAPEDDEPLTPEEQAASEAGWREYRQGKARPWKEVRKGLARG